MSRKPNLQELADYDVDGSWGPASEGWPETPYTNEKWSLCVKGSIFEYGEYVVVGGKYTYPYKRQPDGSWYDYSDAVIRCATVEQRDELEQAVE